MTMKVIKNIIEMQRISDSLYKDNKRIGLVPTMGFLHEGHLSLIREAKKHAEIIVVSIYVNPAQFAPGEDFDKYPRDLEKDEDLCRNEGVDFLFYPSSEQMYHNDHKTYIITDDLSNKLCGISRPTHFRGVTTIVAKLFNIVRPDFAVFGQKDAQQSLIIRRMVSDLNFNIDIIIAPIVREHDGIAMSSRNMYLSPELRKDALVINKSLQKAKQMIESGENRASVILDFIMKEFNKVPSAKVDYISIVNFENLEPIEKIKNNVLIAIAAFFGSTRLIDNVIVNQNEKQRRNDA